MNHRHSWAPAQPISPTGDPGNLIARRVHGDPRITHDGCDCGAIRMTLWTNGRRNLYITRASVNGSRRLWRGRRWPTS